MKVLVIDDSKFMRNILKKIITKFNWEVVGEAEDGEEGISKYKELNPDLVLLDIVMSKMHGLECLKDILKINENAKIIICSATGRDDLIISAMKEGAIDYITKPFKEDDIIKKFEKIKNKL